MIRLSCFCSDESGQEVWQCKQYTSYVTLSHAVNTHSLLHITLHGIVTHVCDLVPFCVFLLSLLLLLEPWPVPLPPCGRHRGNYPLALRQMRSLALWPKTPLSQVMSPSSSTTSTTQRLLKSSFRCNPATRCPRACLTRNSTARPSAERSLHHCPFRSEKNQRAGDKLITLLKKVCCQLSLCLSCKNGETRAWT